MTAISNQMTVGQMVIEQPARARIFEQLGIDYCCGGKKTLAEICEAKGMDLQAVLKTLHDVERSDQGDQPPINPAGMSLTSLADHIQATHHAYLRRELPRLEQITHKVAGVHGQNHPELGQVRQVFQAFQAELYQHMMKEEQILFPMIRQLDQADAVPEFHCGSIQNPIRVMEFEHDHAGDALARMRELTNDFTPPPEACNTWRVMLDALSEMEADMHQHVHKENNILFPRAIKREEELAVGN